MNGVTGIASALARAWVHLYTAGMPIDLRETRRAEIDADLWDHAQDGVDQRLPPIAVAAELLLRAVLGMLDDVTWRFEAVRSRRASLEGRTPMALRTTARWMGLGGVIGGLLWAGNAVVGPRQPGPLLGYAHLALSMLLIAGLLGFYVQERSRTSKTARAGFFLLFISFGAWFGLNLLSTVFGVDGRTSLVMDLLGVTFAFPLSPGFLLLGIGLKGPIRIVPIAIAVAGFVSMLMPRTILMQLFPSVESWNRGDSPLALTAFFLMGIGLAVFGYSVFRNSTPPAEIRR